MLTVVIGLGLSWFVGFFLIRLLGLRLVCRFAWSGSIGRALLWDWGVLEGELLEHGLNGKRVCTLLGLWLFAGLAAPFVLLMTAGVYA